MWGHKAQRSFQRREAGGGGGPLPIRTDTWNQKSEHPSLKLKPNALILNGMFLLGLLRLKTCGAECVFCLDA